MKWLDDISRIVPEKNEMNVVFVINVYFINENELANSLESFNQEQTEIEWEEKTFFIFHFNFFVTINWFQLIKINQINDSKDW